MENHKDMANIFGVQIVQTIVECLKTVLGMGMVYGFKMEIDIKDSITMIKKMVMVNLYGSVAIRIMDIILMI